jgi:hypothetical protein
MPAHFKPRSLAAARGHSNREPSIASTSQPAARHTSPNRGFARLTHPAASPQTVTVRLHDLPSRRESLLERVTGQPAHDQAGPHNVSGRPPGRCHARPIWRTRADEVEHLPEDAGNEVFGQAIIYAPSTREAGNLANRFHQHGESYLKFITTPGLDPTNNVAEQAIRRCLEGLHDRE